MHAFDRPRWIHAAVLIFSAAVIAITLVILGSTTADAAPASRYYEDVRGANGVSWGFTFVTSDDGFFESRPADEAFYDDDTLHIAIENANDIHLVGPDGAPLTIGRYDDFANAYDPQPGRPGLNFNSVDMCPEPRGSFTVHEIEYAGQSVVSKLAVDIDWLCDTTWTEQVWIQVRFNSNVPMTAVVQDPRWTTTDLGWVPLGTHADTPFVFTNVGDTAIAFGTASLTGPAPLSIHSDSCSSGSLAAGAACTIVVRLTATTPARVEAELDIPMDTPLGGRTQPMRGFSARPSTTTIEVTPGRFSPPEQADIVATISPPPGPGTYQARLMVDGKGVDRKNPDAVSGEVTWKTEMYLPTGQHSFQVVYEGGDDPAIMSSESEIIWVTATIATSIDLASSENPALTSSTPEVSATLSAASGKPSGGSLVIKDLTTDTVLGSVAVDASHQSLTVQPAFSAGTHLLEATYSGHSDHGRSKAKLEQVVLLDATATIRPSRFYPVVDGYRDTLIVKGVRGSSATVDIEIGPAGGLPIVKASMAPGSGSFRWVWDGIDSGTGKMATPGLYDTIVTLDDGGGDPTTIEKRIELSHDYVTWTTKRVVRWGKQFSHYLKSRDARISNRESSYRNGVRLKSRSGAASVLYTFPVAKSKIYGWMSFQVWGRSPNRHKAVIAIHNPARGGFGYLDNYDVARKIGPAYRWWNTGTPGQGRPEAGKVRAALVVWKGLGRWGNAAFDIRRVRLVYRVGTLHTASVAGESSLERDIAAAAHSLASPTVTDLADSVLPHLSSATTPTTELKLRLYPKTITAVPGARKVISAWTCPADDRSPWGPDQEPGTGDDDCDPVEAEWRLLDEATARLNKRTGHKVNVQLVTEADNRVIASYGELERPGALKWKPRPAGKPMPPLIGEPEEPGEGA